MGLDGKILKRCHRGRREPCPISPAAKSPEVPAFRLGWRWCEKVFCLEAVLVIPLVHQTATEIVLATSG